jgi:membrane-bound lytic murein transglycosylase D
MRIFAALFFAVAFQAAAQRVEVPHKVEFAGITLMIHDDARREIQKDVDAMTASPRHFQIKVERARTYFPLIEKIFREEGVPDDFKYLALQESALIPDAVSSSNAVGFWQFKDYTAIEMGLRVDREIDERLNIVSSSRAAARYLIKNNQFFDNWLYALQSYQMGAGGVMKSVQDTQAGSKRMEITGKTYWYVKRFLAHKIAYEGAIKGTPQVQVVAFENNGQMKLERLAKETQVDESALYELNKWVKSGTIPGDKKYVVLLPIEGGSVPHTEALVASSRIEVSPDAPVKVAVPRANAIEKKVNGVRAVQALAGEDAAQLAARSDVDLGQFLRWNDLSSGDVITPGRFYFLGRKRLKGSENFHKVSPGESLWVVSQMYGIQMKRLLRYNRMEGGVEPAAGTMLYLASRRPKADAVMARVADPLEVNSEETFSWSVSPKASEAVMSEVGQRAEAPETVSPDVLPKDVDSLKILQASKTIETLGDTVQSISLPIPASGEHTVQAGETLYGIAKVYNLTVMELVSLNKLDLQAGIHPGQVLKLSASEQTSVASAQAEKSPQNREFYHQVRT